MTLIDWSDPEAMLGLLIEYVDDEAVSTRNDAERSGFLHQLSRDLLAVAEQGLNAPDQIARSLREIHDDQPREYANDPVMIHVEACIDEITRISSGIQRSNLAG
ncbi:MAG TPA: hypothetical protein VGH73_09330 [Thermoanaerobaculia bacterium]|jgi:hypothetical protein